jgi:2-methylcitrate dehydratase PrpD
MGETKELVLRCHDLNYDAFSEEVIDKVKYLALDYLGVAARGSISDSSRLVQDFLRNLGSARDGAVVIGTSIKADPPYAAIANGAAAHSLELDDVVNEASLHPAVAIISAALAAGSIEGCSGKELIEGIVVGYEVMIRLGISLDPSAHYAQGFHPTGTCGTMGSAITAAKILRLDQKGMVNALGIAGSQASGSMEFLTDGAFTKRLHPGWAAHSGIIAALLSRQGFTGPGTIVEGKNGFLHAYSAKSNPSRLLEAWRDPYMVMRTSIKPHSRCRYKQGPIDGVLEIMREKELQPSDIKKVTLGILKTGFPIIVEPQDLKYNPKSVVDAQFSMPFGTAVAMIYGKATLDEYIQQNVDSGRVKDMMKKVVASVTILTKNGKEYSIKIDYPKGDPENPLTWDELIDKFKNLTTPIFPFDRMNEIIDRTKVLEKEVNLKSFSSLLSTHDLPGY